VKPLDLAPIKARAEAATPGPWLRRGVRWIEAHPVATLSTGRKLIVHVNVADIPPGYHDRDANADFIAHSREDVPALVAEVEKLREALLDFRGDQ
jgi:hypothetical protein